MKKLLSILFLFIFSLQNCFAQTTYYVSATGGNDGNSGTDQSAPWQSITKVNSFPFASGDNILFKSGDSFQGKLILQTSGVTYGSYGTGAMPVITGFSSVTSWTNKGGNIWESTSAVSSLAALNVVVIGGKSRDMGHTPNVQSNGFIPTYYTFQSHSGNTSITSTSLDGVINWKGADMVFRSGSYVWNKATITNQSGGTLTFPATSNTPSDGYGFWIQNDIRTLDQQNEWYYNDTTKKLDIYSTSMPTGVQVPQIDTLLYDYAKNNVTINGIDFEGANNTALAFHGTQGITVENCDFHFVGQYAIDYNHSSGTPTIIYNDFADIVQYGFFNQDATGAANISHNTFERINLVTPIWAYDEASGAINCVLPSSIIQWNRVDSVGRKGILFRGANVDVSHNYVTNFAFTRQDAGGIYTGYTGEPGKQIHDNIVMYGWGNDDGMPAGNGMAANGIYCDDWNSNLSVYNNTVAHVASAGIFLHNADYDTVRNNLVFDHSNTDSWTKGGLMIQTDASMQAHPTRNNRITNNIFCATAPNRYAIFSYNTVSTADSKLFGVTDSNYYMNPIASDANMFDFLDEDAATYRYYDLAGIRTLLGNDTHSTGSTKFISSLNDIVFVYNPTDHDSTMALGANYINAKNTSYNGTITLQPFTSAVLLYGSPIPVSNDGGGKIIFLRPRKPLNE